MPTTPTYGRSSPSYAKTWGPDPVGAYHRSGYAEKIVSERVGGAVQVAHIVGGGARNALLCQLTADACDLPVIAGPVEGTALGNVMVQARTLGARLPDLPAMRSLVRDTQELRRYEPSGSPAAWDEAEARIYGS